MTNEELINEFKSEMDKLKEGYAKVMTLIGGDSLGITSKQIDTINRYSVKVLKQLLKKSAPTISEDELITIYNGYYGDDIDNLKQIKSHMFDGLELLEFVNTVLAKKGGHNDTR